MSQIGMTLGSLAGLSTHVGRAATSAGAPLPSASFADQLEASFHARAKRLGLEPPKAESIVYDDFEPADDAWARVTRADFAINGATDAIMRSIAEAADARHEKRHRGGSDLFAI